MFKRSFILTIVFLLVFTNYFYGAELLEKPTPVLNLNNSEYVYLEDGSIPSFIDRTKELSPSEVLSEKKWTYNPDLFNYSKDLDSYIWFKFKTSSDKNQSRVLHLYNGLIPLLKVYKKEQGNLVLIDSLGSVFLHDQRGNDYRDAVIELPPEKGENEYYFMVYAKYYHGFDIAIRSYENLFNYALHEYHLLGAFYGVLFLVFLYNLFYFFQLKEKLYLLYSCYVLVAIIASASTDLTAYWRFWPDYPQLNKFMVDQSRWVLSTTFVLYAIQFLELRKSTRIWFWLVVSSSLLYIGYNFSTQNLILSTNVRFFLFTLALHLVLLWLAAFKVWRIGNRYSGIFLVGLSAIVLAFLGQYLRHWEMIPVTVNTQFIMHYGILIEVLVLTYANSYKFKQERESKILALEKMNISDGKLINQLQLNKELQEKVNLELEAKVKQKTKDLQVANDTLTKQSEEIFKMNEELAKLNGKLYMGKKKQQQARALNKNMSPLEFYEIFPSKIECYTLIDELKSKREFACKKCEATQFTKGVGLFSKRCTKCGYNESITSTTIFKGFRSSIPNGFYMVYLMVENNFELSSTELAKQSGLGVKSTWKLNKDIQEKFGKDHSKNWLDFLLID